MGSCCESAFGRVLRCESLGGSHKVDGKEEKLYTKHHLYIYIGQ